MSIRIQRKRIINRRTSQHTAIDPAQMGAYYARLGEGGKLTLTGVRNQVAMRAEGVLAAKWENEETLLLVIREEDEDEPVVLHAFKSRVRHEWETEDFPSAHAHVSQNGAYVAVEMTIPNPFVAVLPIGRVAREFAVRTNLGAPAESIDWSEADGRGGGAPTLTLTTGQHHLRWSPGKEQFKKSAREA